MNIVALDIGYGAVKMIDVNNTVNTFMSSVQEVEGFSRDRLQERDTIKVKYNDKYFEVGNDADLAGKNGVKVLKRDYISSDQYGALFHASLKRNKSKTIDVLVTGLPVSHYKHQRKELIGRLNGKHTVGDNHEVNVNKTIVIPQPYGSYLWFINKHMEEIKEQGNQSVFVDFGYFTADWITIRDHNFVEERSGSNEGSMSAIIDKVQMKLETDGFETDRTELDRIFQHQDGIGMFYGEKKDLNGYAYEAAEKIGQTIVERIHYSLGLNSNISTILLSGGAAKYMEPCFKKGFEKHSVRIIEEPVTANVRGFHLVGTRHSSENQGQ